MLRSLLTAIICMLVMSASAADNNGPILIRGQQDVVMQVLQKSVKKQYQGAHITDWPGHVGYLATFSSFMNGPSQLGVGLRGMSNGNATGLTAFRVEFTTKVTRGDTERPVKLLTDEVRQQAAANPELEVLADPSGYRPLGQQSSMCMDGLKTDPNLKVLNGKISVTPGQEPTLQMLSDQSLATPAEKTAIADWAEKRSICFGMYKLGNSFFPGNEVAQANIDTDEQLRTYILQLYKGEVTYGQFNQLRLDLRRQLTDRLAAFSAHRGHEINEDQNHALAGAEQQEQQSLQDLQSLANNRKK